MANPMRKNFIPLSTEFDFLPPLKILITTLYLKCNGFFQLQEIFLFKRGRRPKPGKNLRRSYRMSLVRPKSRYLFFILCVGEFPGLNRNGHLHQKGEDE
jgi:hypothetical protein